MHKSLLVSTLWLLTSTVLFADSGFASRPELTECRRQENGQAICQAPSSIDLGVLNQVLDELEGGLAPLISRVKRVVITDAFVGSAMTVADISQVDGSIAGYDIYITRRVLEKRDDLSNFLEWKEAQFLGRSGAQYLLGIHAAIPRSRYPTLFYVLLHELGHVAWYEHGVDKVKCDFPALSERPYMEAALYLDRFLKESPHQKLSDLDCEYTSSSFMAVSWIRKWFVDASEEISYQRLPQEDVDELAKICFYGCDDTPDWSRQEVQNLYKNLYEKTAFTSVYSAYFRPEEDFAESFALRYLALQPSTTYVLEVSGGFKFDLFEKIGTPSFKHKALIVDEILGELSSTR